MKINLCVKVVSRGFGHFELATYVKDRACSVVHQMFEQNEVMNIWKVLENKEAYKTWYFLKVMEKHNENTPYEPYKIHYKIIFSKFLMDDFTLSIYREHDDLLINEFKGCEAVENMDRLIGKHVFKTVTHPEKKVEGQDFSSAMDPQILGEAEWEKEFSKIDQNIKHPGSLH